MDGSERMCVPNKFGGLGFGMLHELNVAMLAKHRGGEF